MLLTGDELGRSQGGNNNATVRTTRPAGSTGTCLCGTMSFRFARLMIALRKAHPALRRSSFFTGQRNSRGLKDIDWHGCQLYSPGWFDPDSGVLAFTLGGDAEQADLHIICGTRRRCSSAELHHAIAACCSRRPR